MIVDFGLSLSQKSKVRMKICLKLDKELWTVLATCLLKVISILFMYGYAAFYVLWFDMLLFLLVFVIKFRVDIYRFNDSSKKMKSNIRVERAIMKILQQELTEKIRLSIKTIIAIELEKYIPPATVMMKIVFVFAKRVEDIFFLEGSDWD